VRILFVASEAVPFAKTGGLGDVVGVLPRALAAEEQTVSLMLPEYDSAGIRALALETVDAFFIQIGFKSFFVQIKTAVLSPRLSVFFISQELFFSRKFLYGDASGAYPDNFHRFLLFQKAVVEFIRRKKLVFDIIHCHDWQAALVPLFLRLPSRPPALQKTKTVFSIHNLGYQGIFTGELFPDTGLPAHLFTPDYLEFFGNINFMKAGIIFSDWLLTVSPTYAREILSPEHGFGLDGLLNKFSFKLGGILNGVDYGLWNPESDMFIDQKYSRLSLEKKRENKESLYAELGIPAKFHEPLLAVISRIAEQKGIDLLVRLLPDLLREDVRLVVLGEGDGDLTARLKETVDRFPGRCVFINRFDERMAHRLEAAADIFFMPSVYEPCGLNQIYSMKYGTVPIVRATGGLEDSVVEFDPQTGNGTGFKFRGDDVGAIMALLKRALTLYRVPQHWKKIQENGMRQDFSWEKVVLEYISIYNRIRTEDSHHG
jgi:starch synthase